jgi:C_GCAxxG_C_C family probable redox protein
LKISKGLPEKAYDIGFKCERDHGNCAQCTYKAITEILGLESHEVFRAAYGLAGGGASMGTGSCGAYSGGLLAINTKYGRQKLGDDKQEVAINKSQTFYEKFVQEYGSCICRDVQKKIFGRAFDFRDSRELIEFERAGGRVDKCPSVVGNAARWATQILTE